MVFITYSRHCFEKSKLRKTTKKLHNTMPTPHRHEVDQFQKKAVSLETISKFTSQTNENGHFWKLARDSKRTPSGAPKHPPTGPREPQEPPRTPHRLPVDPPRTPRGPLQRTPGTPQSPQIRQLSGATALRTIVFIAVPCVFGFDYAVDDVNDRKLGYASVSEHEKWVR